MSTPDPPTTAAGASSPSPPAMAQAAAGVSPAPSSSSTTPTTADRSPPPPAPAHKDSPEVLMLESDDEDANDVKKEEREENASGEDKAGEGKKGKKATTGKRKATTSASSTPATKKSKPSPPSSSSAAATKTKKKVTEGGEKPLVEFKKGSGNKKFEIRQKPLKTDLAQSYTTELHAFVAYAVEQLKDKGDKKLPSYPEEHHGFFAKLIHESPSPLEKLAKSIQETLVTAIVAGLSAACEDSQEMEEQEWDEKTVKGRVPLGPLRTLIETLATRTNYGLSPSDLSPALTTTSSSSAAASTSATASGSGGTEKGAAGAVVTIPSGLEIWVWEVEREELWVSEFAGRLEKRRQERQEIKRAAVELFTSLSEKEQRAVLGTGGKSSSAPVVASSKEPKGKGKGKAKEEGEEEEEREEADGAEADGEGEEEKPDVKGKGKAKGKGKKDEAAAEEKAAARAAKALEKSLKAQELAEKRAAKAEKDAIEQAKKDEKARIKAEKEAIEREKKEEKARIKAERQREEEKKHQLAKKQKSLFTSFFVKKSASPAPSEAGPSNSSPAKATTSDFDRVFLPFTIRERVEVAPPNRFYKPSRSYEVEIDSKPDLTLKDSLSSFLSTASKRRIPPYNPYPSPALSVRATVNAISDATLTSLDVNDLYDALKDPKKVKVKHFRFKEDLRPGYVGTWTKTSAVVGPRTPFARDTAILNYEHDSEAEWEEEVDDPDAEELASDGERSGDEKEDGAGSDVDSWLAEDDEIEYEQGYDADGDVVMLAAENGGRLPGEDDDDVVVVESDKVRKQKEREAKKRKSERERRKKREIMLPVAKGMFWQEDVEMVTEPALKTMRIQLLNDATFGLNPFTFVSKPFVAQSTAATSTSLPAGKENVALTGAAPSEAGKLSVPTLAAGTVNTLKAKRPTPKKPFPSEHLPALLRMLHGSQKTKPVIVSEFHELMKSGSVNVPKITIDAKLKEIDAKRVKNAYVVDAALLAQHGITA
ncbi:hypothetical protein JCM10908_004401 [Rhodotorula pacifica]|uniref:uncharacterized protein n=1 Tax=Rhodotorula pacifica TaxID=1495444 RepID=UPI00317947F4